MLQAGVENFFDSVELGAPKIAHIIKTLIDGIKTGFNPNESSLEFRFERGEFGIHNRYEHPDQRGIE